MDVLELERPERRRAPETPEQGRAWPVGLAVLAAVVAVLAAAGWSMTRAPELTRTAVPGRLAVDSGTAVIEQVVSAARPQHAMPGMGTDDDPVAEGQRRVSVDLVLQATGGPMSYDVQDFGLTVPGQDAVAPHRSVLPGRSLPSGTQLSGTLVFDVPVEAQDGELSYGDGPATELVLPLESEQSTPAPAPDAPHLPAAGHEAG